MATIQGLDRYEVDLTFYFEDGTQRGYCAEVDASTEEQAIILSVREGRFHVEEYCHSQVIGSESEWIFNKCPGTFTFSEELVL